MNRITRALKGMFSRDRAWIIWYMGVGVVTIALVALILQEGKVNTIPNTHSQDAPPYLMPIAWAIAKAAIVLLVGMELVAESSLGVAVLESLLWGVEPDYRTELKRDLLLFYNFISWGWPIVFAAPAFVHIVGLANIALHFWMVGSQMTVAQLSEVVPSIGTLAIANTMMIITVAAHVFNPLPKHYGGIEAALGLRDSE